MGERAAVSSSGDNKKKWPWMADGSVVWQQDMEQWRIFAAL